MSRSPMRAARALGLVAATCFAAGVAVAGPLYSVDFGPAISTPHDFSGVETAAAAADSAFSAANVWNALRFPDYDVAAVTDPVFSGLKTSSGATSGVSFSLTGSVNAFDFTAYYGATPTPDALRDDFLLINSGRNPTTSFGWAISGLAASTRYSLFAYGTKADEFRLADLVVDTNGDSSLADEMSKPIGSLSANRDSAQDAYFASLTSDASGVIRGSFVARPDREANWAGFQLAEVGTDPATVPEPGTLGLAAAAGLALIAARRRSATQN